MFLISLKICSVLTAGYTGKPSAQNDATISGSNHESLQPTIPSLFRGYVKKWREEKLPQTFSLLTTSTTASKVKVISNDVNGTTPSSRASFLDMCGCGSVPGMETVSNAHQLHILSPFLYRDTSSAKRESSFFET